MRNEKDLPWLAEPLAAWRDGQRGHALILHGGFGSGLFELALRLAQAWLCEQPPGPCDQCPSCHLVQARTHTDLRVVMPETWAQTLQWGASDGEAEAADGEGKSKKKPSRDIKVEAVRQAIDWAHSSSGRGRGKVLVFFPADAMNTVSANALLKTLEEPGQGVRILLAVEDPEHLLPTIRSRCQRLRLVPPAPTEALAWLNRQGVKDADTLLQAAGGEPLAAQALAADGVTGAQWSSLPAQLAQGDARWLSTWSVPQAVKALQQLCHDLMAHAVGAPPRYFPVASLPRVSDASALAQWSRELARVNRHADHPWQAPLLIEALMAQGRAAVQAGGSRRGYT
ncbi:DNA polymerase III subunit delta' [Ideonella dechloratans]|uniref:DNA polymerase III subunit delta' n=1 Tax=Ideonella dechloratans TaxID=36863 RepID=UPI0035AD845E